MTVDTVVLHRCGWHVGAGVVLGALVALGHFQHDWKRPSLYFSSNFITLRSLRDSSQGDIALAMGATAARADDPQLVFHNHRFEPDRIEVPANRKFRLQVKNFDDTSDEFEGVDLNRETLVPPGETATVYLGPLDPGEYKFFGDFHQDTARGVMVAKMSRLLVGLAAAAGLLIPLGARADFHIHSPDEIDLGELEIEHNGAASFDRRQHG